MARIESHNSILGWEFPNAGLMQFGPLVGVSARRPNGRRFFLQNDQNDLICKSDPSIPDAYWRGKHECIFDRNGRDNFILSPAQCKWGRIDSQCLPELRLSIDADRSGAYCADWSFGVREARRFGSVHSEESFWIERNGISFVGISLFILSTLSRIHISAIGC